MMAILILQFSYGSNNFINFVYFFFSITLQHLIALIHIYRIAANELTIQSGLFQSAEPGRTTKLCPPLSSITNFFSFLNICTTNLIALIHIYRIVANGLKQLSKIIAISWAGKHYKAIFHVFFHQDHFFNFLNMYITNLIVLTHIYTTGYTNGLTIQSGLLQSAEPGRTTKLYLSFSSSMIISSTLWTCALRFQFHHDKFSQFMQMD